MPIVASTPLLAASNPQATAAKAAVGQSGSTSPKAQSDIPLITYVYAETPSARANLEFFIAHGLHAAADFVFVLNGETDAELLIPDQENIGYIKRPNDCYDLGSHSEVLKNNDLYKQYKRFILMNASIRGPFLPYWAGGCWSDLYLSKLSDKVKVCIPFCAYVVSHVDIYQLVGMTGNCWPQFHIQSMIWATDITGLELLMQPEGIGNCFHDWQTAVNAEIHSTSLITDAGYEVDAMMSIFHSDKDYIAHCDNSVNGDYLWEKKYNGANVHPYETIFLKSNRDIDPVLLESLTTWHNARNYSSYDVCLG